MLIDAVQSVGRFIKITAAKVHDKNFLKELELISHSMVVFDRAYNYYHQFAIWTSKNETELPTSLFLWGKHNCHLHAGLVYLDSTTASDGDPENVASKKGFLRSGISNTNSSYQFTGCI